MLKPNLLIFAILALGNIQAAVRAPDINNIQNLSAGLVSLSSALNKQKSLKPPYVWVHEKTLLGHDAGVTSIAITPDSNYIVTGSADSTVKIWDVDSDESPISLNGHKDEVLSVNVTPDGKKIISGAYDNNIHIWNFVSGQLLRTISVPTCITAIAITSDSQYLVAADNNKKITKWNLKSYQLVKTIKLIYFIHAMSLTDDNNLILGLREPGPVGNYPIWIVDIDKACILKIFKNVEAQEGVIFSIAISPDNKKIVSGLGDHTIKIWDVESALLLKTLTGHAGWVTAITITPDSKYIISGSMDGTIKMWDLNTGDILQTISSRPASTNSLAIAPDGTYFVSGSPSEAIEVWKKKFI